MRMTFVNVCVFSVSLHCERIFTKITLIREIFCVFLSYQTTLARFHILYVTFVNVRVLSSDSHVPEHIFTNITLTFYNLMVFSWITLSF